VVFEFLLIIEVFYYCNLSATGMINSSIISAAYSISWAKIFEADPTRLDTVTL
jgi:hypothetical protein